MELQFNEQMVPIDTACNICGGPIRLMMPEVARGQWDAAVSGLVRMAVHDECYRHRLNEDKKRERAEQVAAQVVKRNEYWTGICPPEFQKELDFTDPACKKSNFDKVMAWKFGAKGLMIHGRSGRCKTRFLYKLLYREFINCRKIMAMRHQQFRMTISLLASNNQENLAKLMARLVSTDILFLDDLGKGTLTPASEEALSEVIDFRTSYDRPIFFSTNDDFTSLKTRLSPDRGEPIIRRILDKCEVIHFD